MDPDVQVPLTAAVAQPEPAADAAAAVRPLVPWSHRVNPWSHRFNPRLTSHRVNPLSHRVNPRVRVNPRF